MITQLRLISGLSILLFGCACLGQPVIRLDYPHGRFREETAPKLFKWSVEGTATSSTLEIFRSLEKDGAETEELLRRFDFTSGIDSLTLPSGALPIGKYAWKVSVFDDLSPVALASEQASFEVKSHEGYDLRTTRIGLFGGASRGSYASDDPNFNISFDTTPTLYGLHAGGAHRDRIWDAMFMSSDFVLRGNVFRTFDLAGNYLFPLNDTNHPVMFYIGPSLHAALLPQVRSNAALSLSTKNITTGAVGAQLVAQSRLDQSLEIYARLGIDAVVVGSQPVNIGSGSSSYGAHFGFLFGQFWPLGLGADVGYETSAVSTKEAGETVTIKQNRLSLQLNVNYAL